MTDPIIAATRFIAEQMEWLRHHPAADEHLDVIEKCVRRIRGVVDGPAPKRYLGPCGNELATIAAYGPHPEQYVTCEGDVYGTVGGKTGTCRMCGAQVDQGERRRWLDDEVRQYAYTPSEIVSAYPEIKRNTINQWASRGRLTGHDVDGNGRARYNLGDVLDLAAVDAARRETDRATRERRAAARAEETSDAA